MLKKCIGCGKMFEPWPGWESKQKYCTIECMEEHEIVNDKMREVTCVICGKTFYTHSKYQKTCSSACRYEYKLRKSRERERLRRELKKQGKRIGICVVCGSPFERKGNKITCSKECSNIWAETKHRERYFETKGTIKGRYQKKPKHAVKCIMCGKIFMTAYPYQKTCGQVCSRLYSNEKAKEYQKRRRRRQHDRSSQAG